MEKISVIITAFNAEKFLEKCLDSIVQQTYNQFEVILINDGSVDQTSVIGEAYAKMDSRIRMYNQKNGGVSAARNKGIYYATGEYYYFCDADDYLEPSLLETLISLFARDKGIDLGICNFYIDNNPFKMKLRTNEKYFTKEDILIELSARDSIQGYLWNKMFKASIIKGKNILFDESLSYCEDSEFCYRYILECGSGAVSPLPLYHYVQHEESAVRQPYHNGHISYLKAYDKILFCTKDVKSEVFQKQLLTNYTTIHVQLVKLMNRSKNNEDRELKLQLKSYIKKHIRSYINSGNAPMKSKCLAILYGGCGLISGGKA